MLNKKLGFTLIELLVVIGIILILAALIIVNVNQARMNGRDSKRISDLKSIQTALELSYERNKAYPSFDTSSTSANWTNFSSDLEQFILPMPKDTLNGKTGINIVRGVGESCDDKESNASPMEYQYRQLNSCESYKIMTYLEVRCEGLDKNDGGNNRNNMYELWGGKEGNTL